MPKVKGEAMEITIPIEGKHKGERNHQGDLTEMIHSIVIENSYEYARKITKHYAKSFYLATQLLPKQKRSATYALYGFCRYTDNLVDNYSYLSENELRYKLQTWRFDLDIALHTGYSHNSVLNAFIDLLKNYNINIKHAYELIAGIEMDIHTNRYKTYEDLRVFCYRNASVVGLMMSEILGYHSDVALEYAKDLGEAMQITNILRDIKEDLDMDRIYLPSDLMEKYNYTEEDLRNHKVNDAFIHLMEDLMERAEHLYKKADMGIAMLDHKSRFAIKAASKIYAGIIPMIRKNKYDVFSQRVYVSKNRKLLMILKEYIKNLV